MTDQAPGQPALYIHTNAPAYAAFLVVGIIVGALLAWGWAVMRGRTASAPDSSSSSAKTTAASASKTNATALVAGVAGIAEGPLVVRDQKAGFSVAVEKAAVSAPTWVVVYSSKDGAPDRILGAQLFFPASENGTITLLRATEPGQTYIVKENLDSGSHKFSTSLPPVRGVDGAAISVSFKAE